MKKTTLSLAIVAAFGLAGSAFAAGDKDGRGAMPGVDVDVQANAKHPILDRNSDGKITKDEAATNKQLSKDFAKYDTNHDGSLDNGEYAKFEASATTGSNAGDKASNPDVKGTTNDSVPGNKDLPGPGR